MLPSETQALMIVYLECRDGMEYVTNREAAKKMDMPSSGLPKERNK